MITKKYNKLLFSAVLLFAATVILAACGGNATPTPTTTSAIMPTFTPSPTLTTASTATTVAVATTTAPAITSVPTAPTNLPTLNPADVTTVLQQASTNFAQLQSLHFQMVIKQGKVQINGTDVQQVDGDLQASKYQAQVKVNTFLGSFTLPVVGINGKQYMKNEFGGWDVSNAEQTVNLSAILDKTDGLAPTMLKMQNLQVINSEMLNGIATYHIQGTVAAADITKLSFNKLGQHPVTFDLWLSQGSAPQIQQLYIKEINAGSNANFWVFQFSKFDEPLNIKSPV